jgi:23S rRNA (adenine2503-C2)-methyltransferase
MTDLSKDLRQWLSSEPAISSLEAEQIVVSEDGSKKYLFRLKDGHHVESVLIPERGHWTLCISSQVGCAMGCRFCLTGRGGLVRNLEPAEIVNQVCAVKEDLPHQDPLTNIVFMGMGEPLANYESVVHAIGTLTSNNGLQFSNRRVTLSTAGLVPRIDDLGKDVGVNLAVSLNATDDKTRSALMPINQTFPIETLLSACSRFPLPSRRMITFEYVLIAGVNDRLEDARRLATLLEPLRAKINLIPFNAFEGIGYERPPESAILAFQKILTDRHFTAPIRRSKGHDIGAACGQLRAGRGRALNSKHEA